MKKQDAPPPKFRRDWSPCFVDLVRTATAVSMSLGTYHRLLREGFLNHKNFEICSSAVLLKQGVLGATILYGIQILREDSLGLQHIAVTKNGQHTRYDTYQLDKVEEVVRPKRKKKTP